MRTTVALALLLLSSCGSKTTPNREGGAQALPGDLEPQAKAAPSAAQLEAQASRALSAVLLSPKDAYYWNVRQGSGGAVCGEVDSRKEEGRYGGPRPFVVTPKGIPTVSPPPRVVFENPADTFPDFYIRWCASPEELAKLGTSIPEEQPETNNASATAPELPSSSLPADLPSLPAERAPVVASPAVPQRPIPPPAAPPKNSSDDSFFNAVIRQKE